MAEFRNQGIVPLDMRYDFGLVVEAGGREPGYHFQSAPMSGPRWKPRMAERSSRNCGSRPT
jgi:hypothetical protein